MFKFQLLSDTSSNSGVLVAKQQITSNGFYQFIESKDYGNDLSGIVVVLMCYEPEIEIKQRIRFSKKEKKIYMDIILDYHEFVSMTNEQRIYSICQKLLEKMPPIIKKYKFSDFDLDKFMNNLSYWFKEKGFII